MRKSQFNAFCPVEIGDKLRDTQGRVHTITDIACVHYVRAGKVEFRFELDRSGVYSPIEFPEEMAKEIRIRFTQE